ncbi:hypothetical protein P7C71_g214, partial [Lecanoromycetidae sp. Uapishka_2]
MIIPEGYIPRSNRDPGPPISSRGFENIGRSQSQRQGYRARDDERVPKNYVRDGRDEGVFSSRKPIRPEIALHQPSNDGYPEEESRRHRPRKLAPEDDGLEPRTRPRKSLEEDEKLEPRARDLQDDQVDRHGEDRPRRHRHKHHRREHDALRDDDVKDDRDRRVHDDRRDKRDNPDDGGHTNELLTGAGAAAAATGLAVEGVRRHRRHKEHHEEDDIQLTRRPRDQVVESEQDDLDSTKRSRDRIGEGPRDDLDPTRRSRDLLGEPHRDDLDSTRRPRDRIGEVPRDDLDPPRRSRDLLGEPHRDDFDTSSVSTGPSVAEDREYEEARKLSHQAKMEAEHFIGPVEPELRQQASYERRPEPDYTRHHRSYRPRRHHPRTRDEDSYSSSSSSSSSDSEDDRVQRQVRVVTPSNEDKPPPPAPKSILRKPREKFPEHPTTIREGVAPHKDQKKKDVPPNARWTKIDRRFVNPEALEADGIRFNEFVDHVIVLKVMDIEEIEKYTQKTAEIRAQRRMLMGPDNPPPPPSATSAEGPF